MGESSVNQDVLDFISRFKGSEDVFLHGCCYWFAWILKERFHEHGYLVDIFHDPVEGHFIARFIQNDNYSLSDLNAKSYFYDIRGDVTHLYSEDDLENIWLMSFEEQRRWGRLMCCCREFIDPEDYPDWLKY